MLWIGGENPRVSISALDYLLAPNTTQRKDFGGVAVADTDPGNRETCGIIWQCFILFYFIFPSWLSLRELGFSNLHYNIIISVYVPNN